MLGDSRFNRWIMSIVLVLSASGVAIAARPSDTLLPATTKGYLAIPDPPTLREHWNMTQLGQLMQDPSMQPFVEDIRRQFKERLTRIDEKLGLTLEDLQEVAGGELSVGLIQPGKDKLALAFLVDVSERQEQAVALLKKLDQRLTQRKAEKRTREIVGTTVAIYKLPKRARDVDNPEAAFFIHDEILCGSDNVDVADAILRRFSGDAKDSLAQHPAYRTVMDRCKQDAGQLEPDLRWYVDPFGCLDAIRAARPPQKRKKGKDMVKILASQGFSAIQALGGHVSFFVDDRYELMHRTLVYAPPVKGKEPQTGGAKFELAARMLDFPNGGSLAPDAWIPSELAVYTSFNWDVQNAFDAAETLVDAIIGSKGAFQDILDGIREDQSGPQIDFRTELVGHLGNRCTIMTDYQLPITPQSERWLFAVQTTSESQLSNTTKRLMETDQNAHRRELNNFVVWEIAEEGAELPQLTIESPTFNPVIAEDDEPVDDKEHALPSSAVCVAHGHLMVASHYDFLVKVLVEAEARETLGHSTDYHMVAHEAEKLGPDQISLRFFSRTDEAYRPTYELIRTGKMPEAESMMGQVLNGLLGDDEEDVLREQKIDGSKLPDFEMVRRYLSPAGLTLRTEVDGWYAVGFTLNKEAP